MLTKIMMVGPVWTKKWGWDSFGPPNGFGTFSSRKKNILTKPFDKKKRIWGPQTDLGPIVIDKKRILDPCGPTNEFRTRLTKIYFWMKNGPKYNRIHFSVKSGPNFDFGLTRIPNQSFGRKRVPNMFRVKTSTKSSFGPKGSQIRFLGNKGGQSVVWSKGVRIAFFVKMCPKSVACQKGCQICLWL